MASAFEERYPGEAAPRLGWGGRTSDALVDMFEAFNASVMPGQDSAMLATHAVRLRCQDMLLQMPTTVEQDLQVLEGLKAGESGEAAEQVGSSDRARLVLAVEFRARKKALLQHMLV